MRQHDVLDHWLTHGQITPRQASAGRRFRDLYDVAGIERHAFIDLGGPRAPLTSVGRGAAGTRAEARSDLQDLRPILGAIDSALVCRIVGAGGDLVGSTAADGKEVVVDAHAAKAVEKRYLAHRIAASIAAAKTGDLAFIVTGRGSPFVKGSFGTWFREVCDTAGVKGSAHGLGKAGATRVAENGATDEQLMALFGWADVKMATHYTRTADKKRPAADAARLLVPERSGNEKRPHPGSGAGAGPKNPRKTGA